VLLVATWLDPDSRAGAATRDHALPKEFALLETFMRRPGEVLSRYQLLEHCWDYAYENRSNVVDVYVRYLREKIDRPFDRDSIETVRGAGYRLRRAAGARAR
jgi:DNA-binding response OmpR family regulator